MASAVNEIPKTKSATKKTSLASAPAKKQKTAVAKSAPKKRGTATTTKKGVSTAIEGVHAKKTTATSSVASIVKEASSTKSKQQVLIEKSLIQVAVLQKQGNHKDAQALCELILRANPKESRAYHFLGLLALGKQNSKLALEHFEQAAKWDQTNALAFNNLGVAQRLCGFLPEALVAFDRAIALQKNYAEALNNKGVVLKEMGKKDEALACFAKALKQKPDYQDAKNNRAALTGAR